MQHKRRIISLILCILMVVTQAAFAAQSVDSAVRPPVVSSGEAGSENGTPEDADSGEADSGNADQNGAGSETGDQHEPDGGEGGTDKPGGGDSGTDKPDEGKNDPDKTEPEKPDQNAPDEDGKKEEAGSEEESGSLVDDVVNFLKENITLFSTMNTKWYVKGEKEFTLNNSKELRGLAYLVNDPAAPVDFSGVTIYLGKDISLSDGTWVPIGSSASCSFAGTFDGAGHTISKLTVTGESDNRGLFGFTSGGAEIKNLLVEGTVEGRDNVGGLIGAASKTAVINCGVNVKITAAGEVSGGIIGKADTRCTVENSFSRGECSGVEAAVAAKARLKNCYYEEGSVTAQEGEEAVEKPAEAFASGEVAYLLDGGESKTRLNVWSQGTDGPCFATKLKGSIYRLAAKGAAVHGTVTAPEYVPAGSTVPFAVQPDEGYLLQKITVEYADGKAAADSGKEPEITMGESDGIWSAEFVSQPVEKSFTVTLHGNGGTIGGSADKKLTAAAGAKLTEQIPQMGKDVQDAYAFEGWYSDSELTKPYLFGEAVVSNLELYAKWEDRFLTGTKKEPFQIKSAALLAELSAQTAAGNSYENCFFILGEEIQLKGSWTPIGTAEHPFAGSFDGGGRTIKGLKIDGTKLDNQGLFGFTDGAAIKNLLLQGSVTGKSNVGALIGSAKNTTVAHCGSEVSVKAADGQAGGLIGAADSGTTVTSCFTTAEITGKTAAAVSAEAAVSNCYFIKGKADGQAGATAMEPAAFQSGEAAYLLDGGKTGHRAEIWAQGKNTPVFAAGKEELVYRILVKDTGKGILVPEKEYLSEGEKAVLSSEPGTNGPISYVLRLAMVTAGADIICADSGKTITFTMPGADVTAKGEFVEKTADEFTVTFDANGGSFLIRSPHKTVEVKAGEKLSPESVRKPMNASRDYIFTGWFVDKQCTKQYDFNLGVTEDFVLYAGWSSAETVKVIFDLNGGEGSISPQMAERGGKITRPEEPKRTAEEDGKAYRFVGWYRGLESTEGPWNFDEDVIPKRGSETEFTLYAWWTTVGEFESGTKESPYLIETADQLSELAKAVNKGRSMADCYFALAADVDLSGCKNWTPIGNEANPFCGSFDGRGMTVSGLKISESGDLSGLFGYLKNSTMKDLTVSGSITDGKTAGGIAAKAEAGVFENCVNAVAVSAETAGGILGADKKNSTFTNCRNTAAVAGTGKVGGILGELEAAYGQDRNVTSFTNCSNSGTVKGDTDRVGGILGAGEISYMTKAVFEGCLNTGRVSGGSAVGGIAGGLRAIYEKGLIFSSEMTSCENRGTVEGQEAVGGLMGQIDGIDGVNTSALLDINQCANTGRVSGAKYVGGLGGLIRGYSDSRARVYGSEIYNSYNTGDVTASSEQAGGIIGSNENPYDVKAEVLYRVYSSGRVTAPVTAGSIIGTANITESNYTDCYALEGCVSQPVDAAIAEMKSAAEMKSSVFAYQLDGGDGSRSSIWTQGDPGPIFASNGSRPVFRLELGTVAGGTVSGLAAGGYYKAGSTVTLTVVPAAGNVLKSYTLADSRGNVLLTDCGSVTFEMPESSAVFSAQCVEKTAESFQVTFHGNGGLMDGLEEKTVTVPAGGKAAAPSIHKKTEDGVSYILQGWYSDEDCKTPYEFNIGVTENLELYAAFRVNGTFTVNYDLNTPDASAEGKPDSIDTYRGKKVTAPEDPAWKDRADETHRFLGWAPVKEAQPEEYWNFEQDTISPLLDDDSMTLYAQWEVTDLFLTGSETAPFAIADVETLSYLAKKVNWGQSYEGCYFRLTGDDYELQEAWNPIGTVENPFSGSFDGNGKEVSGLTFAEGFNYNGLFGCVNNSYIHDITVSTGEEAASGKGKGTAGIAGGAKGAAVFRSCVSKAHLTAQSGPVGGILGVSESLDEDTEGVTIDDCQNMGRIEGSSGGYTGGIAGQLGRNVRITSCENTGEILGSGANIGGIVGKAGSDLMSLSDCTNSAKVSAAGKNYVGGVAGYLTDAKYAGIDLSGCINTGEIVGGNYVSGLFGYANNGLYRGISRCTNDGDVTATGANVGGIAGYLTRGTIVNHCLNTGAITTSSETAATYAGGIIGGIKTTFVTSPTELQSVWAESCLNTGSVTAGADIAKAGAIMPLYFEKNVGNYSMTGAVSKAADAAYLTEAAGEQLASGEIAWNLNQGTGSGRVGFWGQKDGLPHPVGGEIKAVYKLKIKDAEFGTIETTKMYAAVGEMVSITGKPQDGYIMKLMTAVEEDGTKCRFILADNTAVFGMPDNDITVNATFISGEGILGKHFTVSFDSQGGSAVRAIRAEGGKRIFEPSVPTRTGYVFMGWYEGAELFDFNTAITEDLKLTARWKSSQDAIVTFRLNRPIEDKGSAAIDPQTVRKGNKIKIPSTPTWTGADGEKYRFVGWFTERVNGKQWNFETDTVSRDITLYARWEGTDLFFTGTTEENPAVIDSPETLRLLATKVNLGNTYEGYYFKLGENIDMNDLPVEWDSIGFHIHVASISRLPEEPEKGSLIFEGTFDGGGNTITLMKDQGRPLFGCLGKSGTITNLNIKGNMKPDPGRQSFAGVVGYNFGLVENCHVDIDSADGGASPGFGQGFGGIAAGNSGLITDCTARITAYAEYSAQVYMGGIVGLLNYGSVKNCTLKSGSKLTVSSNAKMAFSGGIIGAVGSGHTAAKQDGVVNCVTEAGSVLTCVKGEHFAGIAGQSQGDITNCVNNAAVINEAGAAAGISGQTIRSNIQGCANTGKIQALGDASGLVGYGAYSYEVIINNCYNTGEIISQEKSACGIANVGSGPITNCYSYGTLNGPVKVGIAPLAVNTDPVKPQPQTISNTYIGLAAGDADVLIIPGITQVKELEQFTNGEIAYLLDGGDDSRQGIWTQGEAYPVHGEPGVFRVTTEIAGRTEGGSLTLNPDSAYIVGGTEVKVEVNVSDPKPSRAADGKTGEYVYTLTAVQNDVRTDITKSQSFVADGNTHIIARFELEEELYEEEPEKKPEPDKRPDGSGSGSGGGNGSGSGQGTGSGTGAGTGNGEGTDGTQSGTGDQGTGTGSGTADTGEVGQGTPHSANSDAPPRSLVADSSGQQKTSEDIRPENDQEEGEKRGDSIEVGAVSGGGDGKIDPEETKKVTVFEIVKKAVQENPLMLLFISAAAIGVLGLGILSRLNIWRKTK